MRYPHKVDPSKLDFSQFHPLDHHFWEPRCREFHGGPRRHIEMWWDFVGRPKMKAATVCRVGLHKRTTAFWPRHGVMFAVCTNCHKRLGPNQPMDQIEEEDD